MKKFVVGSTPYSDAERKRDTDARKRTDELQFIRRKARRSGQNYNKRGSRAHQRAYARMVGSE